MTRELFVGLPREALTVGMRETRIAEVRSTDRPASEHVTFKDTATALDVWRMDDEAHRSLLWDDWGCTIAWLGEESVQMRRLRKFTVDGAPVYRIEDLRGMKLPDVSFIVRERMTDRAALDELLDLWKSTSPTSVPDHMAHGLARIESILRATGRIT